MTYLAGGTKKGINYITEPLHGFLNGSNMNTFGLRKEILEMDVIELALAWILVISIVFLFLARNYINYGKII